jgi:hypothetical protein
MDRTMQPLRGAYMMGADISSDFNNNQTKENTMKLKSNTTHVILNDGAKAGTYEIWSQHRSEDAANKLCRTLGKNGKQGHTVVVPVARIANYKTA